MREIVRQNRDRVRELLVAMTADGTPVDAALAEMRRLAYKEGLEACGGNQTEAARRLGVSRDRFRYFAKKQRLL